MRNAILTIKCYREAFGDAGLAEIEIAGTPFFNAKEVAKNLLLTYFNDQNIPGGNKPHGAALVHEDGRIVAQFELRLSSTGAATIDETSEAPASP